MRCEQITSYLPGFAGGDLRPDTMATVASHVDGCARCAAEVARHERVLAGLATIATREVEPPAYLLDAIIESVPDGRARRILPVLPVLPPEVSRFGQEVARVVSDNREAITQAAGTALVAAAAAYAFRKAMRSRRAGPATP